jgi:ABC-2 type transport system permease protein
MNWTQIQTVLWLRWRLTRNQWTRGGRVNAVLTMLLAVLGVCVGVAGTFLGFIGGYFAMGEISPRNLLLVWDGLVCTFLFLWIMGVLAELQRSETIDLSRLLHLPISLKGVFLVNFLASHLSVSLIIFLPGMLGLAAGLTFSRGLPMLLLFPLILSVILMVTAWTYCLRGWLISLMVNQRRKRSIMVLVMMVMITLPQLPNLYFNVIAKKHASNTPQNVQKPMLPSAFIPAHNYIPFLWPGKGAMSLANNNVWPAIWPTLIAFTLGALGLHRSYVGTLRFYQGQENAKPVKVKPTANVSSKRTATWLDKTLPWISEETSTLTLSFLRSFSRAPEMKMALGMNFFMMLIMAGVVFRGAKLGADVAKPFLATAAVAFQFMGLLQSMANQFGFDREGFRALVLLPTQRKKILLAKNLAFLPITGGLTLIFLCLIGVLMRVPVLDWLAAVCQFVFGFALFCGLGNVMSVYVPYRIGVGSLKPTKMPGKAKLVLVVTHMFLPLFMVPLFIPPVLAFLATHFGGWPGGVVNLFGSMVLAGVAILLYWVSLEGMARVMQEREKRILQVVTTEIE